MTRTLRLFLASFAAAAMLVLGVSPALASPQAVTGNVYVDPQLGFTLRLPSTWGVSSHSNRQTTPRTATVIIGDKQLPAVSFYVYVVQMADAASTFTQKRSGQQTKLVGTHTVLVHSIPGGAQHPQACSERTFVDRMDYVDAQWCGDRALAQTAKIERILGSYQAAAASMTRTATASSIASAPLIAQAHPAQTCAALASAAASAAGQPNPIVQGWGAQIGTPTDTASPPNSTWLSTPGWDQYNPGSYICSNGNPNPLSVSVSTSFQCTEFANRFLYEQWNLPSTGGWYLGGNAGQYLDYHDWNNVFQYGSADGKGDTIITYDARWATNSAPPQPGDLLIWQDVANPATWESAEIGAGHVAVVTGTDASYVYTAQQNVLWASAGYENGFMAYSLQRNSNGQGWSVDLNNKNGVSGRITRGWIHFTENTGPASNWFGPTVNGIGQNTNGLLAAFHRTSTNPNQLALNTQTAASSSGGTWTNWSNFSNPSNPSDTIAGDPAVGQNNDGRPYVFVRGALGKIYQSLQGAGTGGNYSTLTAIPNPTTPTGFTIVGNPAVGRDNASGKLMVFARGSDNHMYVATQTTAGGTSWGTFSFFSNPPNGDAMVGDPAVGQNSDGMLWVFMRGSPSNLIWVNHQQTDGNFSGWSQLPNITGATNPTVGRDSSTNKLMVFVGDVDNHMYYVAQTTTGEVTPAWGSWGQFSSPSTGQAMVGNPKVVMSGDGRLFVFMRGTKTGIPDNIFLNYELQPGGSFSGWTVFSDPGGVSMTGDPSAGLDGSGMLHMFVRGADGHMYHSYTTGGDWVTLATFGTGSFA